MDLTVLSAHTPHSPLTEWTIPIPAFSFPAEAGPQLSTQEGWKAELAWKTVESSLTVDVIM